MILVNDFVMHPVDGPNIWLAFGIYMNFSFCNTLFASSNSNFAFVIVENVVALLELT